MKFSTYKRLTRASIVRNWHSAPEVKDHFLMACYDTDIPPETAATLFKNLVNLEGVAA